MTKILTEEELNKITYPSITIVSQLEALKASHRILLSANAELSNTVVKQNSANLKLVYENDELLAENMKLKAAFKEILEVDEPDYFEDIAKINAITMEVLGDDINE